MSRPKIHRVASTKTYDVNSYKENTVSRSIDWSKYMNPMIPEPKPERPGFVKINYLKSKKVEN